MHKHLFLLNYYVICIKLNEVNIVKNAINYYYNLSPINIHQIDRTYKFEINGELYVLLPYTRNIEDIEDILSLMHELNRQGIYTNQIVLNKDGSPLTKINEIIYIMIKAPKDNRNITIEDIMYFSNITLKEYKKNSLWRNDWYNMWMEKIDYIEYQINNLGKKYALIRSSISYIIGLAENAIALVNTIQTNLLNYMSVSHRRINHNFTLFDLYNPINFVMDYKVRDICEYFKFKFFYKEINIEDVITYINNSRLSKEEAILFFARMLFLTPYFDVYESIIDGYIEEEAISHIINKLPDYEKFIKELYNYMNYVYNIGEIEWLKKT